MLQPNSKLLNNFGEIFHLSYGINIIDYFLKLLVLIFLNFKKAFVNFA